jgi:hypothetical protein
MFQSASILAFIEQCEIESISHSENQINNLLQAPFGASKAIPKSSELNV